MLHCSCICLARVKSAPSQSEPVVSKKKQAKNWNSSNTINIIDDAVNATIHVSGVCFNVPDCEFTGGVSTDSLVTFDDCCNKIGGKSRALHNGACRNCIRNGSGELLILVRYANKTHFCCFEPELSPTVAEPSPNGNSDSISDWTPWGACSHTCGPSGTRSRQNICGPSNKLTVCKEQDQKCNRDVSCPGIHIFT